MNGERTDPARGRSIPPPIPPTVGLEEGEEENGQPLLTGATEEAKFYWAALAVAVLTTGMLVWCNARLIERRRGDLPDLSFEFRAAIAKPLEYAVDVTWQAAPADSTARPELQLDRQLLPDRPSLPRYNIVIDPENQKAHAQQALGIRLPGDLVPGRYEALIQFRPRDPPPGIDGKRFPVTIAVPGLLQEWSLLVSWLMLAGALWLLAHAGLLHVYPAPRGTLKLRYLPAGEGVQETHIRLQGRVFGFFLPWRRSAVNLGRLLTRFPWGRAAVGALPEVWLQFGRIAPFAPVFLCVGIGDTGRVRRLSEPPPYGLTATEGIAAMTYEPFFGSDPGPWFVLWTEESINVRWVAFRHTSS